MAVLVILTYGLRTISVPGVYSIISAEIPVMSVPIEDPAFHNFKEIPNQNLRKFTPTILLTTDAFYFGDMNSFSQNLGNVRDKFMIRHVDGEPQLLTLLKSVDQWGENRQHQHGTKMDDVAMLVPSGEIPLPIVMQVLAGINNSKLFKKVILGGGML
jgi:hypothetical protein